MSIWIKKVVCVLEALGRLCIITQSCSCYIAKILAWWWHAPNSKILVLTIFISLSNKTSRFHFFFYTDSSTMYHLKWWKLLQGLQNTRFLVMTFSFLHKLITLIALFCSLFCLQICKIFSCFMVQKTPLHCTKAIKHTIIFIGVSSKY